MRYLSLLHFCYHISFVTQTRHFTVRFQNRLAYPPVFLTDFANWAKSARSTSPPLWKVLPTYPCLWPTGMYNKYFFYLCSPYQRVKKVVSNSPGLEDFVIGLVNLFSVYSIGKLIFLFRKFSLQKNCDQSWKWKIFSG